MHQNQLSWQDYLWCMDGAEGEGDDDKSSEGGGVTGRPGRGDDWG